MRRSTWLATTLLLIGWCGFPATAALKWTNADHANNDHWSNPANWADGSNPGWVPTATDDVLVIKAAATPADPCVVSTGQVANKVNIGYWSFDGSINIESTGVLTCDNLIAGGQGNTGILNVNGGVLTSRIMNIGTTDTGTVGIVNLNGGQINLGVQIVVGNYGNSGRLNIYDGVADVGKLYINPSADPGTTGIIDIHHGTLIVTNAANGQAQYNSVLSMIAAGKIIGFDGIGTATAVWDGGAVTTVTAAAPTTAAGSPYPADGLTGVPQGVILTWQPGELSAAEDVYIGDSAASVAAATPATPGIYRGRQDLAAGSRFASMDLLAGQTYYWRVDGIGADGVTIYPGQVWQFTVAATNPICTWVPTVDTDWFNLANWNTALLPTPYTDTNIYKPTDYAVIDNGDAYARNMLIGIHGFTTQVTVSKNGTLAANRIDLGKHNVGSHGTLLVDGGTVETASALNVGYLAGNYGTLTLQTLQAMDPCVVVGSELSVGVQAGATGTVNLLAGELTCTALTLSASGGSALVNIERGRLTIPGDQVSNIESHVAGGKITAYNHHVRGKVFAGYLAGQDATVVTASAPDNLNQAWWPRPADQALIEDDTVTLTWAAGDGAAYHDVYFGMGAQAVAEATASTPGTYRGRIPANTGDPQNNTFALADALLFGQTHYWRIDTVEADGTTIYPGQVWQFDKACPGGDLNGDCRVDMEDFCIMASEWRTFP